jgi:hypothetical protein
MDFDALTVANQIASHDLVATYIYPDKPMKLGEQERYSFRDAEVRLRKCGNRFGQPNSASTVQYTIIGDGFRASLRAVWARPEDATAKVSLLEVTPSSGGQQAYNAWLMAVDTREQAA